VEDTKKGGMVPGMPVQLRVPFPPQQLKFEFTIGEDEEGVPTSWQRGYALRNWAKSNKLKEGQHDNRRSEGQTGRSG
jgi:hypothetical protein